MRKILLLLGIFVLITSCKKDEDNNQNNPDNNTIIGSWKLIDVDTKSSRFDNLKFIVFTSDNKYYELFEDENKIRDYFNTTFIDQDDNYEIYEELISYSLYDGNLTLEYPDEGSYAILTLKRVPDITIDSWLPEIEIGSPLFTTPSSNNTDLILRGIAWTGQKLWVLDDSDSPQVKSILKEIDINNGSILNEIDLYCYGQIDYNGNYLLLHYNDYYNNSTDPGLEFRNPINGELINTSYNQNHNGRIIGHDGEDIWLLYVLNKHTYTIAKCDEQGNILTSKPFPFEINLYPIYYHSGYFWFFTHGWYGDYIKLVQYDLANQNVTNQYLLKSFEANYVQTGCFTFVGDEIWAIDRNKKFYKFSID